MVIPVSPRSCWPIIRSRTSGWIWGNSRSPGRNAGCILGWRHCAAIREVSPAVRSAGYGPELRAILFLRNVRFGWIRCDSIVFHCLLLIGVHYSKEQRARTIISKPEADPRLGVRRCHIRYADELHYFSYDTGKDLRRELALFPSDAEQPWRRSCKVADIYCTGIRQNGYYYRLRISRKPLQPDVVPDAGELMLSAVPCGQDQL